MAPEIYIPNMINLPCQERKTKENKTNKNDRQDEEKEGGKETTWYFQQNCWTNFESTSQRARYSWIAACCLQYIWMKICNYSFSAPEITSVLLPAFRTWKSKVWKKTTCLCLGVWGSASLGDRTQSCACQNPPLCPISQVCGIQWVPPARALATEQCNIGDSSRWDQAPFFPVGRPLEWQKIGCVWWLRVRVTKRFHDCTGRLSELSYERHFNTSARSLKKKVRPMLALLAWLQSIFQNPALSNYSCRPTGTLHQGQAAPLYCCIHRVAQLLLFPVQSLNPIPLPCSVLEMLLTDYTMYTPRHQAFVLYSTSPAWRNSGWI